MSDDQWVERILRVVDHIQGRLDEEIAPEELARVAAFSLHHFHRVFRGMTGESVMAFVRRLRLERSARRLKHGDSRVTEIALSSGYGSHEAFTRAFRARFGASPSAYRESARASFDDLPVTIREEPERHCVSLRYVGAYEGCEAAWGRLMLVAANAGLPPSTASIGLVYDDPDVTPAERLRYDACLVLLPAKIPAAAPDGCVTRTVPPGRYAVALHRGSFDTIFETYVNLLGRWLPHRNVELFDEPVVEVYLNNPTDTAPEDLRTEVCVRIA